MSPATGAPAEAVANLSLAEPPWLPLQRAVKGVLRGLGGAG